MNIVRLLLVVALTGFGAYIHGSQTFRWGTADAFAANDQLVTGFPAIMSGWKQIEESESLSDDVVNELGLTDYLSSSYESDEGSVGILLMSGKAGRLVRHTPDICYGASGNEFVTAPKLANLEVDGVKHQFGVLPIRQPSLGSNEFVVVYGFARDGVFSNPASPRLAFHGTPSILKIQVLCRPSGEKPGEIPEYAKSFLTEICRYVGSKDGGKSAK